MSLRERRRAREKRIAALLFTVLISEQKPCVCHSVQLHSTLTPVMPAPANFLLRFCAVKRATFGLCINQKLQNLVYYIIVSPPFSLENRKSTLSTLLYTCSALKWPAFSIVYTQWVEKACLVLHAFENECCLYALYCIHVDIHNGRDYYTQTTLESRKKCTKKLLEARYNNWIIHSRL